MMKSEKEMIYFEEVDRMKEKWEKYSKSIRRIRHSKDWNDIFNENQKMGCGDYNRGKMGKANV